MDHSRKAHSKSQFDIQRTKSTSFYRWGLFLIALVYLVTVSIIGKRVTWWGIVCFSLSVALVLSRWKLRKIYPILFLLFCCFLFLDTGSNFEGVRDKVAQVMQEKIGKKSNQANQVNQISYWNDEDIPNDVTAQNGFLVGYNWGILHILVQRGISKLGFHFAFEIFAFALKMIWAYNKIEPLAFAAHVGLVLYMLFSHVKNERLDRKFFNELYNSKETFKNFRDFLAEYLPSSLVIFKKFGDKCIFVNNMFKDSFAIKDPEEALTKLDQITPCAIQNNEIPVSPNLSLKDFMEENANGIEAGKIIDLNVSYVEDDSTKKPFEAKIMKLFWDGMDAFGVLLQDTSLQEANLTLKIANENQEKAISTVAHELRNPVNGLLGIAKLMEKNCQDPKILHFLSILKSNISLLLNILNSVLDIQQIRASKIHLNIAETSLPDLLGNIGLLYEFQFTSKGLQFKTHIDKDIPPTIMTDKNRLSQILINLTANALKFTLQGSITISVVRDPQNPQKITFKVTDTGIGIKPDDCSKLFQMFGKLTSSINLNQEGVGLGLMISNSLVKTLNRNEENNQIKVESVYGTGSTFFFSIYLESPNLVSVLSKSLILIPEEASSESENEIKVPHFGLHIVASVTSSKGARPLLHHMDHIELSIEEQPIISSDEKKVLLVDDDMFGLIAAKEIIKSQGLTCYTANNGKEAIEKAFSLKEKEIELDLILIDCEMPIMNGFEATIKLVEAMQQKKLSKVPIIGLSGNDGTDFTEKCKKVGMKGNICKPLTEEVLIRILNDL